MAPAKSDPKNNLELEQANKQLVETYNKINAFNDDLSLVDAKLQSFGFATLEFMGLAGDAELEAQISDEALLTTATDQLSRQSLERKQKILRSAIRAEELKVPGLQDTISTLKAEARDEKFAMQQNVKQELQAKVEAEYLTDADLFYEKVLLPSPISQHSAQDLYRSAKLIIAASEVLKVDDNHERIVSAWDIVAAARDRAFDEYKQSTKVRDEVLAEQKGYNNLEFFEGARACFDNMVDKLPIDWQALKFLYRENPDKAENYFKKIGSKQVNIETLREDINSSQIIRARRKLEGLLSFESLPKDVQELLIQQQAYVFQLEFDLMVVSEGGMQPVFNKLQNYQTRLADNIFNAIENNKSLEQIKQETEQVHQNINAEAARIKREAFKNQLTESAKIPLGAGLGAVYFLGLGVTAAAAAAALTAATKAMIETSDERMQMPRIDKESERAAMLTPTQYRFLRETEEKWRALDGSQQEAGVEIRTIRADIDSGIEKAKDAMLGKASKVYRDNLGDAVEDVTTKGVQLYGLVVGVGILSLAAVTIALPAAWPVLAVTATGIGGWFGYLCAQKIKNPSKPAPSILGPLVDSFYNFFSNLGKNLRVLSNKIFVNPFKASIASSLNTKNEKKEDSVFTFPAQSLQALKRMSPKLGEDLATKLARHFQGRLDVAKNLLYEANSTGSSAQIHKVTLAVQELEDDWNVIISAAQNPDNFCDVVDNYLEKVFSKAREDLLSKEKKTMTFSSKGRDGEEPLFDMKFDTDLAFERKEFNELLSLKTSIKNIKGLAR